MTKVSFSFRFGVTIRGNVKIWVRVNMSGLQFEYRVRIRVRK